VLFIMESFIMPLQIRRINYPLKESLKDIQYNKEFLYYLPSLIILIVIIYSMGLQQAMGNIGLAMNFMRLNLWDWVICLALCAPSTVAFEAIRHFFRKKEVVF